MPRSSPQKLIRKDVADGSKGEILAPSTYSSALPLKADIKRKSCEVRFVPRPMRNGLFSGSRRVTSVPAHAAGE
jgi:hypothetical protein